MKTSVGQDGIITIQIRGNEFKFEEGSCDSCPLQQDRCTKIRDPRNPGDEHLDFMDFCQTLEIDNLHPLLNENSKSFKKFCGENGIYTNPIEKPY